MLKRADIRAAIVAALEHVYSGFITTSARPDLQDQREAILVRLERGDADSDGLDVSAVADLKIQLLSADRDDDQMDDWADSLIAVITPDNLPPLLEATYMGWEYSTDDTGQFNSLDLRFEIIY